MLDGRLTIIEYGLHMVDMVGTAGQSIDTLHIQTKELNSLEALIDKERHRGSIPSIQVIQRHTEDRLQRRQRRKIRLEAFLHRRRSSHRYLTRGRDAMGRWPTGGIGRPARRRRGRLCGIRGFPKLVGALLCLAGGGNIQGRERLGKNRLAFGLGACLRRCSRGSAECLSMGVSNWTIAFNRSVQLTGWR